MTLPSSPPLSLTQILSELGRLSAGQSLSGAADERQLSGVASGNISFSDYLGKSMSTPGSQTFNASGNFTVPVYTTLTVNLRASGGGGGSTTYEDSQTAGHVSGKNGTTALQSSFGSSTAVVASGGGLGTGAHYANPETNGANGSAGGGSGGTVTVGGGAAGGAGGNLNTSGRAVGGNGGAGGKTVKTWNAGDAGAPVVGSNISIVIAAAGLGGRPPSNSTGYAVGQDGDKGNCVVSWT